MLLCAELTLLLFAATTLIQITGALLMLVAEFTGCYLFFVSVVPTNMASEYLTSEAE
jgi:hypothetical protein